MYIIDINLPLQHLLLTFFFLSLQVFQCALKTNTIKKKIKTPKTISFFLTKPGAKTNRVKNKPGFKRLIIIFGKKKVDNTYKR